jgi:hypothetical protein
MTANTKICSVIADRVIMCQRPMTKPVYGQPIMGFNDNGWGGNKTVGTIMERY